MDAQAVGKENPVELAALGRLGDRDHMIEVHHQIVAGGPCIRMAPGAAYAAYRGRYGHQLENDSISVVTIIVRPIGRGPDHPPASAKNGRASCRARVCEYV